MPRYATEILAIKVCESDLHTNRPARIDVTWRKYRRAIEHEEARKDAGLRKQRDISGVLVAGHGQPLLLTHMDR
jgi:hypothetical protein